MRRDQRRAAVRDAKDATAMREFYTRMSPSERDAWISDNPSFKTSDHSALTVLQWREHARIRGARGTGAAHEYTRAIEAQAYHAAPRATYSSELRPSRGGAVFLTLCGLFGKGALFVPLAYVVGGVPLLALFGITFIIYATFTLLGSIISARPL